MNITSEPEGSTLADGQQENETKKMEKSITLLNSGAFNDTVGLFVG